MASGAYLYDLGLTPYGEALAVMQELAAARTQQAIPDTVMLLEHEPVITLGSRAVRAEELPLPAEEYESAASSRRGRPRRALDLPRTGPARLLSDPRPLIARARPAPLRPLPGGGARRHARRARHRRPTLEGSHASGVWAGERKIASIGVRCARWVTSHGLALNVDLDLGVYDLFDACGLGGAPFTSLARETGEPVTTAGVREPLLRHLSEALEIELDPLPATEGAGALVTFSASGRRG